jgi:cytochrome c oxidase assembly protein subunit 15
VLTSVVVVASAWLRLVQLASGCDTWTACQGMAADNAALAWTRLVHRIAASAVAVLAIASVLAAHAARERGRQIRTGAALVALAVFLAVLGVRGSSLEPAVAVANVLGGMAMLALFWRLALAARPSARVPDAERGLVRGLGFAALGLLALQIALGVLTSVGLAGRACPDLLSCVDALNVWHGVTAALLATILFALAAVLWRLGPARRGWAIALALLTTAEIALGPVLIAFDRPVAGAALHSALAAMLVVVATWAASQPRSDDPAAVSALCHIRTSNQPPSANTQR